MGLRLTVALKTRNMPGPRCVSSENSNHVPQLGATTPKVVQLAVRGVCGRRRAVLTLICKKPEQKDSRMFLGSYHSQLIGFLRSCPE